MYQGTICVVLSAIILLSTSAPSPANSSDTANVTSKFESLITNLKEIKKNATLMDEDKFVIVLKQFNFTCRTFTFVMMLKLQLQDQLFENTTYSVSEIEDILHKLTHLETAATILNDIAVHVTQRPCVIFAPEDYEKIYQDTLAKSKITDEGESERINKLLNRMLDEAGQVLDLVTYAFNQ